MAAPNKAEREKCWESKDAYWNCLDKNNSDASKCKHLRKDYEGNCTKSWVKYFDRRYDYLKYKNKIEKEGYEPIDESKQKS